MFNFGTNLVSNLIAGLNSKVEELTAVGTSIMDAVVSGFDKANDVSDAADNLVTTILNTFENKLEVQRNSKSMVFYDIGERCIEGFKKGLDDHAASVRSSISSFTKNVSEWTEAGLGVSSPSKKFYEIAAYCMEGFKEGIEKESVNAVKPVLSFAKNLLNSIRGFFGIKSPSTVMRDEVGTYLVQGIAEGITAEMSAVEAAQQMAQNITAAFQEEFDKFELDLSTFDLEDQLWQKMNPDAADNVLNNQKLYTLDRQLRAQADRVHLAEAQYKATVQAMGENNEETQRMYNALLQEYNSLASYASSMAEIRQTFNEDMDTPTSTVQNYDRLLEMGFSSDYLDAYLAENPARSVQTKVGDIMNDYLSWATDTVNSVTKQVEVQTDTDLAMAMANAISAAADMAGGAAGDAGEDLADDLTDSMNEALEEYEGIDWTDWTKNLFGEEGLDFEGSGIMKAIDDFGTSINKKMGSFFESGSNFFTNIVDGFKKAAGITGDDGSSTVMQDAATTTATSFMDKLNSAPMKQDVADSAETTFSEVSTGITNTISLIETQSGVASRCGAAAIVDVETREQNFEGAGEYVGKGFCKGLLSQLELVKQTTDTVGKAAINQAEKTFDIRSPSKVFFYIGEMVTEGLAKGIVSRDKRLTESVSSLLLQAIDTATYYAEDPALSPTISPVLDDRGLREQLDRFDPEKALQDQFNRTVIQFDAEGNLVPYGYNNTGEGGSWIRVDEETADKVWAASQDMWDKYWAGTGSEQYRSYSTGSRMFADSLLQDLYEASQSNQGQIGYKDEAWQSSEVFNYTQNNYSPVSLSNAEIYRNTRTQLAGLKNRNNTQIRMGRTNDYRLTDTKEMKA